MLKTVKNEPSRFGVKVPEVLLQFDKLLQSTEGMVIDGRCLTVRHHHHHARLFSLLDRY